MGLRRTDEVYIDGVLVGWTDVCEDVNIGNHCKGYFFDENNDASGRIAFDLDDGRSQGTDITDLFDGTMTINIGGEPTTKERWIHLLEDTLTHLKG